MTRISDISLPLTLALTLPLAALGCATDHVEADYITVEAPGNDTGLAPFVISGAFDNSIEIFVQLNDQDLLLGDSGERISLNGDSSTMFSAPAGDYVVGFVDAAGKVLLRTPSLRFAPNHLNDLLAYGTPESLAHNYYSHDWSTVDEGKVRANFFNVSSRKVSGRLDLCTLAADYSKTCEVLVQDLSYGKGWSGEVAPGTRFEFSPDVSVSGQLEFWSMEHGFEGYEPGRMTRVNAYYPLDWVDFDDTECPGCTSTIEHTEDLFVGQ